MDSIYTQDEIRKAINKVLIVAEFGKFKDETERLDYIKTQLFSEFDITE